MSAAAQEGITLLISDVHTKYHVVDRQIEHARAHVGDRVEQVIVLGDFGFFGDQLHHFFRRKKHRFAAPVACIEGNHEDHGALQDLAESFDDCFAYLPRGSVHALGRMRGLFLGGARYMDSWSTPRGCEITEQDIQACMSHAPDAVDLILTHDCPAGIGVPNTPGLEHYGPPGVPELCRLAERYRPRIWFFGHHHRWFDVVEEGTRYIGLPVSWEGYAVLSPDGQVQCVQHEVPVEKRSRWRQWLGLR